MTSQKKIKNKHSSRKSNYRLSASLTQTTFPDKEIVVPCFSPQFNNKLWIQQKTQKYLSIYPQADELTFFNIETEQVLMLKIGEVVR